MQTIIFYTTKTFNYLNTRRLSTLTALLFVCLIIFLFCWIVDPRNSINGLLFTAFFLSFVLWFGYLIFSQHNTVMNWSFGLIAIGIFIIIFFAVIFSWVFFLWNAYFVWKHESHTLPNLLTLIIGITLVFIWIAFQLGVFRHFPQWFDTLLDGIVAITLYLCLVMYTFLVNLILYQFIPRRYREDYLIVLGAGLINGKKVSRLLGARIDRAIAFAYKQYDKGRKLPTFIMSGGQGDDEQISEAQAMKNYAIKRGIPEENILLENQSRNTYENMLFSKEVALRNYGSRKFKAKFFTNNYHLFRAALYAKQAHLHANGVGSTTRFYYLPNATIREFVGVFMMRKKRHLFIIGVIAIIFIVRAILIGVGYIK
ncbi:YdcF family protein [Lactobacillus sp.]|uniref:YdcF family protein n=1 Tax=Lactobacillus sp. TaxID=1591 RepID=UPI00199294E3|nr:YdcF family protein [Lactobacillus sp.]MBD5429436.1 YdcF family protein [Lactobacillus sp.]